MASYIKLTNGEVAIVDDEFYSELSKLTWHAAKTKSGNVYARHSRAIRSPDGSKGTRGILMHRMVQQLAGKKLPPRTDHINRRTLDNRLENLRPATASQNRCNSGPRINNKCGYKGVSAKPNGIFSVMIQLHGKQKYVGEFRSAEEAARAYDAAARELHGEFAYQNFPAEQVA